jgi:hypothetical protein
LINALPRKPIQIALAAILFWIVLYGIGYEKPNCCREITDKSFQASERAQCKPIIALLYRKTVAAQPLQYVSAVMRSSCCDPLNACCKAPENSASIPTALNDCRAPHSSDSSGPAHTITAGLYRPGISEQKPAKTNSAIIHSKTPRYIQLRSILC